MRVAKWGNSLAVRLPKALVDNLDLRAGDEVQVVARVPGELVVGRDLRRQRAVERMGRRAWTLPDGYTFDRNAANER
jgi:antitoxin MazE